MHRKLTRRQALKNSALAGVGIWTLGTGVTAKGFSPNNKLNIASIGIGGQGRSNTYGLGRLENMVGLCDVDDVRAGKAYKDFPKAKKFIDFRVMLDKMDKQIDAVAVSTPDHCHVHPAVMAMERGKHIYLEKPMGHAVWEARKITELAREKKLATQLGVQRHAIPNMHRVVELVKSGAIGKVKECHAWVGGERGMPALVKEFPPIPKTLDWDLWLGPAKERRYSPEYVPYKWRFWWDFGTGETGNWGCHILDIPFWALDLTAPTKIEASGGKLDPQRTPQSMHVRYEFPKEDVVLHWYHAKGGPEILRKYKLPAGGNCALFIGEKGMLLAGFKQHKLFPEDKYADFEYPEKTIPDSPGFREEFTAACRGGKKATCNFDYSGPLAETVILGNVAFRVGKPLEWDAKACKVTNVPAANDLIRPAYRKGWELS